MANYKFCNKQHSKAIVFLEITARFTRKQQPEAESDCAGMWLVKKSVGLFLIGRVTDKTTMYNWRGLLAPSVEDSTVSIEPIVYSVTSCHNNFVAVISYLGVNWQEHFDVF